MASNVPMPDAPSGTAYGPWWDDCDGDNGAWFICHFYRGLSAWNSEYGLWESPGTRGDIDNIYGRQLKWLELENADMKRRLGIA